MATLAEIAASRGMSLEEYERVAREQAALAGCPWDVYKALLEQGYETLHNIFRFGRKGKGQEVGDGRTA